MTIYGVMRALSIRQPFAELILRGIKTAEYRTRATSIIGERFYIYAAKQKWSAARDLPHAGTLWPVKRAENIVVPDAGLPEWMIEIARQVKMIPPDLDLPMGVIVGSAIIDRCEAMPASRFSAKPFFRWHLADVQRETRLRKPTGHPQPVWFRPFE